MTDEANIAEAELAKAMTPLEQANALLKAAEEIVAHESAEPQKQHPADAGYYGRWDKWASERDAFGKYAHSLASALLEKQKALEECLELLDAMVDYCPPARDEWMSNTAYLEYADFYNRVQDFLARQGETA